jgi:hypothetical protein
LHFGLGHPLSPPKKGEKLIGTLTVAPRSGEEGEKKDYWEVEMGMGMMLSGYSGDLMNTAVAVTRTT